MKWIFSVNQIFVIHRKDYVLKDQKQSLEFFNQQVVTNVLIQKVTNGQQYFDHVESNQLQEIFFLMFLMKPFNNA